jgi:DGQHR domain-containing protein
MTKRPQHIVVHALRLKQSDTTPVYLFALTAEHLDLIASVARLTRNDEGKLEGYQRSIAKEHVETIAKYLNSDNALLPNAVILALSSVVKFEERRGPGNDDGVAIAGRLTIPVPTKDEVKPGWIVDGQQRSTAIAKLKNRQFAVPIAAFVTDSVDLQRDQFIRVNSVQPLDKGLVTELLPEVAIEISPRLAARKIPSALVDLLNTKDESPFKGLVRRPSMTPTQKRTAVVQDTSLVNAIQESMSNTSGCLFPFRNLATGQTDMESIWWMLMTYWTAVREAFPEAWALPPTDSRLMHGGGIRSMGRLMDRMMASVVPFEDEAPQRLRQEFSKFKDQCAWVDGEWSELGNLPWNEIQNTPKHIRMLSNALIRLYIQGRAVAS